MSDWRTDFQACSDHKVTGRTAVWLDRIFEGKKNLQGVEVGVFVGQHAKQLLKVNSGLQLTGVDLWWKHAERATSYSKEKDWVKPYFADPDYGRGCYASACNNTKAWMNRVKFWCMSSSEAAELVEDQSLDFVYVDGNHHLPFVLHDFVLWEPKIREGGFLCGHDFAKKATAVREALELFNQDCQLPLIHQTMPASDWILGPIYR